MPQIFDIAVIEGDGIGPEVTREAIRSVQAAAALDEASFEWTSYPWGSEYYFEHGRMAPDDFLDTLAGHDAILLGAVGHPEVQDHVTLNGLLLPIRRRFDQCVCLRPSYLYDGVESPLRDKPPGSIDIQVFRENTEGEYANIGGRLYADRPQDVAVQTSVFTRHGCQRIITAAFEKAGTRPDRHVASITKSNAQGYGMVLWDEVFFEVAKDFPEVEIDRELVDAVTTRMVLKPETLDVVVATNLHADILSDLAAALSGSLGIAPTANLNPERSFPSMFEPIHGSAFDIAGQGIANPVGSFWTAAMMLEYLGENTAAERLMAAIERLTESGMQTKDLGGDAMTRDVTAAICADIEAHG